MADITDMGLRKNIECPYCGFREEHEMDAFMTLAYCDEDHGGCGRWFTISWNVHVTAEALKIEKEADNE